MQKVKQISFFARNCPGVLTDIVRALAAKGVNILAVSVADTVDHAVIRLVCDQSGMARTILEGMGLLVVETDVLCVEMENKPGALATLSAALYKAKMNIEYLYGSSPKGGRSVIYFRVENVDRAIKALSGTGKSAMFAAVKVGKPAKKK